MEIKAKLEEEAKAKAEAAAAENKVRLCPPRVRARTLAYERAADIGYSAACQLGVPAVLRGKN